MELRNRTITKNTVDSRINSPPWYLITPDIDTINGIIRQLGYKKVIAQDVKKLNIATKFKKVDPHGFIHAYKCSKKRLPKRNQKNKDNTDIRFTPQLVDNSSATLSIINIMLNYAEQFVPKEGPILKFTRSAKYIDPIERGIILANDQEIRRIHNSYGTMEKETESQEGSNRHLQEESSSGGGQYKHSDTYNFVSYVGPLHDIWELDSRKKHPLKVPNIDGLKDDWEKLVIQHIKKKAKSEKLKSNIYVLFDEKEKKLSNRSKTSKTSKRSTRKSINTASPIKKRKSYTKKGKGKEKAAAKEKRPKTEVTKRKASVSTPSKARSNSSTSINTTDKAQEGKGAKTTESRKRKSNDQEETERHENAKKRFNLRR